MGTCNQENKQQIGYPAKLHSIFSGAHEEQKDKGFINFRMLQAYWLQIQSCEALTQASEGPNT